MSAGPKRLVGEEDCVPEEGRGDRSECDRARAEPVCSSTSGELDREVRDEERGREQADRGKRHAVRISERICVSADVGDVPREAPAHREPRRGALQLPGRRHGGALYGARPGRNRG